MEKVRTAAVPQRFKSEKASNGTDRPGRKQRKKPAIKFIAGFVQTTLYYNPLPVAPEVAHPAPLFFFFWGEGGDGEFGVGEEDRGGGPGVGSERMGGAGCGSGAIVFERSGWVNLHCCCWIPFFIS